MLSVHRKQCTARRSSGPEIDRRARHQHALRERQTAIPRHARENCSRNLPAALAGYNHRSGPLAESLRDRRRHSDPFRNALVEAVRFCLPTTRRHCGRASRCGLRRHTLTPYSSLTDNPMETDAPTNDEPLFERTIKSLEAEISNAGAHMAIDARARSLYAQEIHRMSAKLRADATSRRITWAAAARQAQETRNLIMEAFRTKSSPVGRAFALSMKKKGLSLNQLIAMKTIELHGVQAVFSRLSSGKQNAIYASIVTSAGKSNTNVTRAMTGLRCAGRGLIFLALALSAYNIATSTNKVTAVQKELAINSASIVGGIGGGLLAGLACGPAAPICVTIGAFAGGALAAFGTSHIW